MFAALNFAIAACMSAALTRRRDHLSALGIVVSRGAPPPLLESNFNPAHILTAYERGESLTASPGGVFVVAQRWVMQCLVSKTGVDHWGDQTSWTDFKIITKPMASALPARRIG